MEADYVVVGAGFFGLVLAERLANDLDASVLVIEKRSHIGGNCYSEVCPETGIEYHKYGTHIFHTNSQTVWDYLHRFTEFNSYHHQVLTTHKGVVYPMPINLETINKFYGLQLRPQQVDAFLQQEIANELELPPIPRNMEEKAIQKIGRPLYEAFIKSYTYKQWGVPPQLLPESIINRIPVRSNYDRSYFLRDRWQGIPLHGYTAIFQKMIQNKKIKVLLNCDYLKYAKDFRYRKKLIFTGPLDQFFQYRLGALQWRSVALHKEVLPYKDFQGTSVMNYADDDVPYTRIHEPRHLHPEREYDHKTVLFYETSHESIDDPYYPIPNEQNRELYKAYRSLLAQEHPQVVVGGRLGNYSYLDMDQVIQSALTCYQKDILGRSV